ncbi:hypothetical protein [Paenibacillus sp. DMB20]|nr:hypothetical protein [Paenibacillus sp. DMB20]
MDLPKSEAPKASTGKDGEKGSNGAEKQPAAGEDAKDGNTSGGHREINRG